MTWQTPTQHLSAKREIQAIRRKINCILERRGKTRPGTKKKRYIIGDCNKEITSLNERIKVCSYFLIRESQPSI